MTGKDPLDAAFDAFANASDHPVWIVTVADGDERAGCLVGFGTQCSIEPRRFLVCVSKANHTYRVLARTETIAVHLVPADRRDLAELFGAETGDEVDKFGRCDWHDGPGGVPLLDGCSALVGTIVVRTDAGDHEVVIVEPVQVDGADGRGVVTYARASTIEAGHPA